MTRGRIPVRARKEADPIAEKRGVVQHYQREPGRICDFAIMSPGMVVHVRIKCVRRLGSIGEETGRELAAEAYSAPDHRVITRNLPRDLALFTTVRMAVLPGSGHSLAELGRDGMLPPEGITLYCYTRDQAGSSRDTG